MRRQVAIDANGLMKATHMVNLRALFGRADRNDDVNFGGVMAVGTQVRTESVSIHKGTSPSVVVLTPYFLFCQFMDRPDSVHLY